MLDKGKDKGPKGRRSICGTGSSLFFCAMLSTHFDVLACDGFAASWLDRPPVIYRRVTMPALSSMFALSKPFFMSNSETAIQRACADVSPGYYQFSEQWRVGPIADWHQPSPLE